jgi:hypothetical protein
VPAKIKPATIRIVFFPYADPTPGLGFFAIARAISALPIIA